MTYTVIFRRSIEKDMRRVPAVMLPQIQELFLRLRTNPFPEGCKKIRGYEHHYRVRIGQYRVVYEVKKKIRIISIIRIGHRREVYRSL